MMFTRFNRARVLLSQLPSNYAAAALLPLLLLSPTQYKGSGQAIAVGSVGIYATCDAGKDKKATDELIAMLEEVRCWRYHALDCGGGHQQLRRLCSPSKSPASSPCLTPPGICRLHVQWGCCFRLHSSCSSTIIIQRLPPGGWMLHCSAQTFTRLGKDHVGRSNTAASTAAADAGGDGSSKGSSIADMLAAEVAELKDKKKDRFKRREGGVRGTLFLEFPQADGELTGRGGGEAHLKPMAAAAAFSRCCWNQSVVRMLCSTADCDSTQWP
jgi:hypothetical protein